MAAVTTSRTHSTNAYAASLKGPFKVWATSNPDRLPEHDSDREREKDRARRTRASLDVATNHAAVPVSTSSRDTRRAQTLPSEPPAQQRPSSSNGYRSSHQPSARDVYQASANKMPAASYGKTSTATPGALPQASTSRTQLETPEHRSYFQKMLSKVRSHSTSNPVSTQPAPNVEEKPRSHKHRSNSLQVPPTIYPSSSAPNPPMSHSTTSVTLVQHQKESSRERAKLVKPRDDKDKRREEQRYLEERAKLERERARDDKARADYYSSRNIRSEPESAPKPSTSTRVDRPPSRREADQGRASDYESDTIRKKVSSKEKRRSTIDGSTTQPNFSHTTRQTSINPTSSMLTPAYALSGYLNAAPTRDQQRTPTPLSHPALRHIGVPIQPSSSSQSTASNTKYSPPHHTRSTTPPPMAIAKASSTDAPSLSENRTKSSRDPEREARRREREKERERLKDADPSDQERHERLREKDRSSKKHRSHREGSHSLPANTLLPASDTERPSRRESKHHRTVSHPEPTVNGLLAPPGLNASNDIRRPESRRDSRRMSITPENLSNAVKNDAQYGRSKTESSSAALLTGTPTSIKPTDRLPAIENQSHGQMYGSNHATVWTSPSSQTIPQLANIHAAQLQNTNSSGRADNLISASASIRETAPVIPAAYMPKATSRASVQGLPTSDWTPSPNMQANNQLGGDSHTHQGHGTGWSTAAQAANPRRQSSAGSPYHSQAATYGSSSSVQNTPVNRASNQLPHQSSASAAAAAAASQLSTNNVYASDRAHVHGTQSNNPRFAASPTGLHAPDMFRPPGKATTASSYASAQSALQEDSPKASLRPPLTNQHISMSRAPSTNSGRSPSIRHTDLSGSTAVDGSPSTVPNVHRHDSSPKTSPKTHYSSQQTLPIARATSSQSSHSPIQKVNHLQVPGAHNNVSARPAASVSRTPSHNSQVSDRHSHVHHSQSSTTTPVTNATTYAAPSALTTPMYSSAQNSSIASRRSHSPSMNNASSVSYNTSSSSVHPNSTSNQNALPRSQAPASSSIPQSSTYPAYSNNQQYPSSSLATVQQLPPVDSQHLYLGSSQLHPMLSQPPITVASMYQTMYSADPSAIPSQTYASVPKSSPDTRNAELSSSRAPERNSSYLDQHAFSSQQISSSASNSNVRPPSVRPPSIRPSSVLSGAYDSNRMVPQHFGSNTPIPSTRESPPSAQTITIDLPAQSTHPVQSAIAQPIPISTSRNQNIAASTRVSVPGYFSTRSGVQHTGADSPPSLSPSVSSHDSNEEILMTPHSLDPAKGTIQPQEVTVTIERPETPKRKPGLFSTLFNPSSKSSKERDAGEKEGKEKDGRRSQTPGPSQRTEGKTSNKLKSKHGPSHISNSALNASKGDQTSLDNPKHAKHIPPPIAIPDESDWAPTVDLPARLRLVSAKRYRAISVASQEALDGTANNTVVGSPTSSVRSSTPGLLTPPLRDAIEAAFAWRETEEINFQRAGNRRRARPGVAFDLPVTEGDSTKNSGNYRLNRASRVYARDSYD